MTLQENLALADKYFAAFNTHDLNKTIALEAANFKAKAPGVDDAMDSNTFRAYNQTFITAFPDLNFEIVHKIAQGDFVVINWIARGNQTGSLKTPTGALLPASNKKAAVHGSTTFEIKNAKAIRVWTFWDMVTLLAQLGFMPVIH